MLSALLILLIILTIVFGILDEHSYTDFDILSGICGILSVIVLVFDCICGFNLFSKSYTTPKKIAMYEEENKRIEEKISATVEKYMQYEKNIIYEVSPEDDTMVLVSLYPDLKSDQLIQSEIDTYIQNNNTIKELKSNMINVSIYKFLVYFGH